MINIIIPFILGAIFGAGSIIVCSVCAVRGNDKLEEELTEEELTEDEIIDECMYLQNKLDSLKSKLNSK